MGLGRQRWLFTLYHLHEPWVVQVTLLEGIFLEAYPARRFQSAWHPPLGPECLRDRGRASACAQVVQYCSFATRRRQA
jgi:hypothetical protein